jgi:ParB-like chromosome segregation protein Spo0J
MAKPKSRVQSAAIAGMLGVASPTSAAAGQSGGRDSGRGEGTHPVRDHYESGVARADNALVLDARRVVRRGRYVRPFTDDHHFQELVSAIEEAGRTIHVPILVRVEGSPGEVEYVLVDGTHRLEAALRLSIPVPAINLGRISADRALAIQAMANEVRASMHVIDQVSYVIALLGQGLSRDSVQRTTGFSAGRVSELVGIGMLLAGMNEGERERARLSERVTHRALRTLKSATTDADAFRRGVMMLAASPGADEDLEALGDEIDVTHSIARAPAGGQAAGAHKGADGYQLAGAAPAPARRGRTPAEPGAVTFVPGRNARGTSVTYRVAWRARAVRQDPEAFLEHVRALIQVIAADATADYAAAVAAAMARASTRRRRRGGGVTPAATDSWRETIAREEAELAARVAHARAADLPLPASLPAGRPRDESIPDHQNPMPVPPSQRRPGDAAPPINPRLLAGLSIPMLSERMKRRPPEFGELETHVSDVERQAEDARRRVRDLVDAEEAGRRSPPPPPRSP